LNDREVLAARGPKVGTDPWRPVTSFIEPEWQADGRVLDVATLFLANRECPFRCVYCDLWKHTLDEPTPRGAVPAQIDVAFEQLAAEQRSAERLAQARVIKLYNSGNFFDAAAIPPTDWPAIADRVRRFERIIVENHPLLIDDRAIRFRDLIGRPLEVAMGLETVHPDVLPRLNKRMTLDDFAKAARFLTEHDIAVRAFVLLRPPFLSEAEGIEWAIKSVEFAFDVGVNCCSVIPTRSGNGVMNQWQADGWFNEPRLRSLEEVAESCLAFQRGRVFADVWDAERFATCRLCATARIERLRTMNLTQTVPPRVACECDHV
jgi:radical SAM enzyme (TIGR01210 family)